MASTVCYSIWQGKYLGKYKDRNGMDRRNFGEFIAWIEITMNFGRQKVYPTHGQSSILIIQELIFYSLIPTFFLTVLGHVSQTN